MVVGLHGPRMRPLVIVHSAQAAVRQRFTFAHELGHILLPWHLGDGAVCDTRWFVDEEQLFGGAEPEANRFASELLIPSTWLASLMGDSPPTHAGGLTEALLGAGVSTWVACLRLRDTLPAGFVFAMVDQHGLVLLSGRTAGTGVRPPTSGQVLTRTRYDRFALTTEELEVAGRRIVWWTFLGRQKTRPGDLDPRSSKEVLSGLVARHVADVAEAERIAKSLGGVIGSADSEALRAGAITSEELVVRFRGRFANKRDLPSELLADADFELWLRKRADDLGVEREGSPDHPNRSR